MRALAGLPALLLMTACGRIGYETDNLEGQGQPIPPLPTRVDASPVFVDATDLSDATLPGKDAAMQVATDGGAMDAPPVLPSQCGEIDLGQMVGTPVYSGTTIGAGDDYNLCLGEGILSPDLSFSWTAPTTGRYVFDTCTSSFDTLLAAMPAGCGSTRRCNDDASCGFASRIALDVTAGETLVLIVDGWGAESGAFVLNIAPGTAALSEQVAQPSCPEKTK